jgi:glycosyltransferase involved in cell wall biosynthesis
MAGEYSKSNHVCIVNIGLYRSGTTTLATAFEALGLESHRAFSAVPETKLKDALHDPETAVEQWMSAGGTKELMMIAAENDIIYDGWLSLLPFLPDDRLHRLVADAEQSGICLIFVGTQREVDATVVSELHHWVKFDLERRSNLTINERDELEMKLRERAEKHKQCVVKLASKGFVTVLPLENCEKQWPKKLAALTMFLEQDWSNALQSAGIQNANPPLPTEGILLTLRLGTDEEASNKIAAIEALLKKLENDALCRYLVIVALDQDEFGTKPDSLLRNMMGRRKLDKNQMQFFDIICNQPRQSDEPFAICRVWDTMACEAWERGADWVMLLGDDVDIQCSFHYRAFYRAFLDIAQNLGVKFGFGCPWWNDISFPSFPSFPCVGKEHFQIFKGLIPHERQDVFYNQDLDPYLQHLYLKFRAAPCVVEATLMNQIGGHIGAGNARYNRIPAKGWRDFVIEDMDHLRSHLPATARQNLLLDVIVPSYRVRLEYLRSITSLRVPDNVNVNFIIIVDNPSALLARAKDLQGKEREMSLDEAERLLERYLAQDRNIVRVRCNNVNQGASASRNRGLDESAAEFVLHLDDDLVPNPDLLENYCNKLFEIDESVVGLVGLVRFPRSSTLPMKHAAVLMSYLTFMFEIAQRDMYESPAWGVTANILFRRTHVRFDLAYAKTGGGEDVDYSLRVAEACNGGKLLAVPDACVVHPFWPGTVFTLSNHFYSWAIGDGALFKRFPEHCYWSFPNVPETLIVILPIFTWLSPWGCARVIMLLLLADFVVDASNTAEYNHRCQLLEQTGTDGEDIEKRSPIFYFVSHMLANLYVVVLECGRLRGHIGRLDIAHGMFRRFDWHIGRLPKASSNFRKREAYKFAFFVAIIAYELSIVLVKDSVNT